MLPHPGFPNLDTNSDLDSVHNYYERLVLQEILDVSERASSGDRDFFADVACVALNHLPPRYIRHDVDMTFFMSPQEIAEVEQKVSQAVASALDYVSSREGRERGEASPTPTSKQQAIK